MSAQTKQTKESDRLPPHSLEAERAVLGCVMLSPNECMAECLQSMKGGPEVFYDLRHQTIFQFMAGMFDEGVPIDTITLHQRLKDAKLLEGVGGLSYLSGLQDAVPTAAALSYYLDIIQEKFLLRRTIRVCIDVVGRVYEFEGGDEDLEALLDGVESDIHKISEIREREEHKPIKVLVRGAVDRIEELHMNAGAVTGVESGFKDLDRMTNGFQPGNMVVIAARPSLGKTSLAMNIAEHAAVEMGLPVGVFSLEMTAEELTFRLLCSRARLNSRTLRDGLLVERDFPKITAAAGKITKCPLFIDDTSGLSILQLKARARRMLQQHGIKLLVVDYMQLLHSTNRRAENRQQEIADISSGLKELAKELRVPVIVLSQLNRNLEREKGRKPRLDDLRESGSIEQDADFVGLLYKPEADEEFPAVANQEAEPVNLLVAKQRNGPTGEVNLTFIRSYTRFESAAKVEVEGD